MTLFELTPLPYRQQGITLKDRKGRAYRRRPWWVDVGKGPEGKTCKTCHFLQKVEFSKTYYKCGQQPITHGPGTQIAMRDEACRLYQPDGLEMIRIKPDFERFPHHLFKPVPPKRRRERDVKIVLKRGDELAEIEGDDSLIVDSLSYQGTFERNCKTLMDKFFQVVQQEGPMTDPAKALTPLHFAFTRHL